MKELLQKWYHRVVYIHLGGLQIKVTILDIKVSYGQTRFLVSPVTGKGEIWVEDFIGLN
jgi:hypothetical protein